MRVTGEIHSIETFATLEGEGIRFCIFMNGCPLRCVYCHNPDTWAVSGTRTSVDELVNKADRYEKYYKNGGGITFSGGEPLLQHEFLESALSAFKKRGYNTAIDTSASIIPCNIDKITALCDLFIVDLKFYTDEDYRRYTGGSIATVAEILETLTSAGKRIWVRTVIVPGLNDAEKDVKGYVDFLKPFAAEKYTLTGYHTMGVYKYDELGLDYALKGVGDTDSVKLKALQRYADLIMSGNADPR